MNELIADGISLSLGDRKLLRSISIKIEEGHITGLLGNNGEGKTSLIEIITGNLKTRNKSVRINGVSSPQIFKDPSSLTYLPQFNFIPKTLQLTRVFDDFNLDINIFFDTFDDFKGRQRDRVSEFSGGERRIIETYLIIKSKSMFSLLDEPFSQITPLQIEKVQTLIKSENHKKGFLITDHLYQNVIEISDHLYLLKSGITHPIKDNTQLKEMGYLP